MKTIGITGGVGAGKSTILSYIKEQYHCRIIYADEAAHQVKEPGQSCYNALVGLLGQDVLLEDGTINKRCMAQKIFEDEQLRQQVNALIHPAVKRYIMEQMNLEARKGIVDFFFVEAALLVEDQYDLILDELWYIKANPEVRRKRLKESRNYSDEKIDSIMNSQLSDEEFIRHCAVVIDNSSSPEDAYRQVDENLRGNRTGHE